MIADVRNAKGEKVVKSAVQLEGDKGKHSPYRFEKVLELVLEDAIKMTVRRTSQQFHLAYSVEPRGVRATSEINCRISFGERYTVEGMGLVLILGILRFVLPDSSKENGACFAIVLDLTKKSTHAIAFKWIIKEQTVQDRDKRESDCHVALTQLQHFLQKLPVSFKVWRPPQDAKMDAEERILSQWASRQSRDTGRGDDDRGGPSIQARSRRRRRRSSSTSLHMSSNATGPALRKRSMLRILISKLTRRRRSYASDDDDYDRRRRKHRRRSYYDDDYDDDDRRGRQRYYNPVDDRRGRRTQRSYDDDDDDRRGRRRRSPVDDRRGRRTQRSYDDEDEDDDDDDRRSRKKKRSYDADDDDDDRRGRKKKQSGDDGNDRRRRKKKTTESSRRVIPFGDDDDDDDDEYWKDRRQREERSASKKRRRVDTRDDLSSDVS